MKTDRVPFLDLASPHRDALRFALIEAGVNSGDTVLSLVMFPHLLPEKQYAVAKAIERHIRWKRCE